MSQQNISTTPDIVVSGTINAPITQVWATVGNFNAFPTILPQIWDLSTVTGSGVGSVRTLSNNAGADIVERLEQVDGQGSIRSIEFSILGGSFADILPVDFRTYDTSIQLQDMGSDKTLFTWSASYDLKEGVKAEDAKALFSGIFNSALDGLRAIHEPQPINCSQQDIDLEPIQSPDASISVVINAPADAVWATIGNFNALPHYLPALWDHSTVTGSGVGTVRTLTNAEGAKVVEKLLNYDGVGNVRSLEFSILESDNFPLPFDTSSYLAFMQVKKLNDHQSLFTWSASYEPNINPSEAEATLEGLFNLAANNLKLIHESSDFCTGHGGQGCSLAAGYFSSQGGWDAIDPGLQVCFPGTNHLAQAPQSFSPISSRDDCGFGNAPFLLGSVNTEVNYPLADPISSQPCFLEEGVWNHLGLQS